MLRGGGMNTWPRMQCCYSRASTGRLPKEAGEWSGGGRGGVVKVAVRVAKRLGHGRQPGSGACHGAVTSRRPVQRLPNRSA